MATTTYLSNLSALTVNSVSLVDQCTGIVFTQLREALDKTTLADTGRTYTGGLYNNECTMTLFQSYAAARLTKLWHQSLAVKQRSLQQLLKVQ
jgi:DNA-binding transcriptional regulator YbjK